MYDNEYILEHIDIYEYILNKTAKEIKEEQKEKENTKN